MTKYIKFPKIKSGTKVKFLTRLGTMETADSVKFNGTVEPGDTGTYIGAHNLAGWHVIQATDGTVVPVHISQIEVVE